MPSSPLPKTRARWRGVRWTKVRDKRGGLQGPMWVARHMPAAACTNRRGNDMHVSANAPSAHPNPNLCTESLLDESLAARHRPRPRNTPLHRTGRTNEPAKEPQPVGLPPLCLRHDRSTSRDTFPTQDRLLQGSAGYCRHRGYYRLLHRLLHRLLQATAQATAGYAIGQVPGTSTAHSPPPGTSRSHHASSLR